MRPNALEFRHTSRLLRAGFSFVEVLFAVMILGIGFIMIAAIFPVSLSQTRMTNEESFSAAMVRGARRYLEQIADEGTLPPTGPGANVTPAQEPTVHAFRNNINREFVAAEMVPGIDARYSWMPFYSRKEGSPYATVYIFPMQVRAQSRYDRLPDVPADNTGLGTVTASFTAGAIQFQGDEGGASPGAYVLISQVILPNPTAGGSLYNGRVYRLGNSLGGGQWEYFAGQEFVRAWNDADGNPITPPTQVQEILRAKVFVIGRGLADQSAPLNSRREGAGQEIGVYVGLVRLRAYNPLP